MSNFLEELKRRNVIKAAIAYVVVAWVLLQVFSIVLPNIGAPDWVMKTVLLLLIIGFPIWLVFSWVYEVTPEGLKKSEHIDKQQSITARTNKRLNILILIGLVVAITVALVKPTSGSNLLPTDDGKFTIAVLPFDDMSEGKDSEWFCDGVTEDILTHLSKISGLRVISRTSTERYKQTDKSIPEIAEELGATYLVEGSVRKHNDQVLITAQLIGRNDEHIWADNYNKKLDDIFEIQQDVSKEIVSQLKIAISPEETEQLNSSSTLNVEAYQKFLKGRNIININNNTSLENFKNGLRQGIALFKEAIAIDKNYADAYAEVAYAKLYLYMNGDREDRDFHLSEAKSYNEDALKINENTVQAYLNRAVIFDEVEDEHEKAEQNLNKALALNPNNATTHKELAYHYLFNDIFDHEKSLYHIKKAVQLDPFSIEIKEMVTQVLISGLKLEEAQEYLEETSNIYKSDELTYNRAVIKSLKNKDQTEAITILKNALVNEPDNPGMHNYIAHFYDGVTIDRKNALKHRKRVFELEFNARSAENYINELFQNNDFVEAKRLMDDPKVINILDEGTRTYLMQDYYAYQNKFKEAEVYTEQIKDLNINDYYYQKSWLYAMMGETEMVIEMINRKEYLANERGKAICFAYLKERDSMYYYLHQYVNKKNIFNKFNRSRFINNNVAFDPYRNEERYKAFLKDNYLPIVTLNP